MNDEHEAAGHLTRPGRKRQDAEIRALLAELGSGPDGENPSGGRCPARGHPRPAGGRARARRADSRVAHRQRRTAAPPLGPACAVAAAAVIVLGAGSVAVANLSNTSPMGQNCSADSAGESARASRTRPRTPLTRSGSSADTGAAALPELGASSFASDVAMLLEGRARCSPRRARCRRKSPQQKRAAPSRVRRSADVPCLPGSEGHRRRRPNQVQYDGRRAVLVIHPERAGRQVVEAWNCAGDRRLAIRRSRGSARPPARAGSAGRVW